MKKIFMLSFIVPILALFLASCELEEEEDSGSGVTEASEEDLGDLSNTDATVVGTASAGETLMSSMMDEIFTILDGQITASQGSSISPSSSIGASAVEEESDSGSWDEEIAGPRGGTAQSTGNWSESYRAEYPDNQDLPYTVNVRSSSSEDETTSFDGFTWTSTSQSKDYQFSGRFQLDWDSNSEVELTIRAVDADDDVTEFDASIDFGVNGGISIYGVGEPVSGTGDAIRFTFYMTFDQSVSETFDETDEAAGDALSGDTWDPADIQASGSLRVFDASGTQVASKEYSSLAELEAIDAF